MDVLDTATRTFTTYDLTSADGQGNGADACACGHLVDVLRTTNTTDTRSGTAPGGYPYDGVERSDVHGVSVVRK